MCLFLFFLGLFLTEDEAITLQYDLLVNDEDRVNFVSFVQELGALHNFSYDADSFILLDDLAGQDLLEDR